MDDITDNIMINCESNGVKKDHLYITSFTEVVKQVMYINCSDFLHHLFPTRCWS
jgi:hypothetical protein